MGIKEGGVEFKKLVRELFWKRYEVGRIEFKRLERRYSRERKRLMVFWINPPIRDVRMSRAIPRVFPIWTRLQGTLDTVFFLFVPMTVCSV